MKELIAVVLLYSRRRIGSLIVSFDESAEDVKDSVRGHSIDHRIK